MTRFSPCGDGRGDQARESHPKRRGISRQRAIPTKGAKAASHLATSSVRRRSVRSPTGIVVAPAATALEDRYRWHSTRDPHGEPFRYVSHHGGYPLATTSRSSARALIKRFAIPEANERVPSVGTLFLAPSAQCRAKARLLTYQNHLAGSQIR